MPAQKSAVVWTLTGGLALGVVAFAGALISVVPAVVFSLVQKLVGFLGGDISDHTYEVAILLWPLAVIALFLWSGSHLLKADTTKAWRTIGVLVVGGSLSLAYVLSATRDPKWFDAQSLIIWLSMSGVMAACSLAFAVLGRRRSNFQLVLCGHWLAFAWLSLLGFPWLQPL
jgi:hypothetical protein